MHDKKVHGLEERASWEEIKNDKRKAGWLQRELTNEGRGHWRLDLLIRDEGARNLTLPKNVLLSCDEERKCRRYVWSSAGWDPGVGRRI